MLKWTLPLLLVAGLAPSGVSAEPEEKTYYRYKTESGSIAFTDELKRVPERYRPGTERVPARSILDYDRTSVSRPGASTVAPPTVAAPGGGAAERAEPGDSDLSLELEPGVNLRVPSGALADEDEPIRIHRRHFVDQYGEQRQRTQVTKGDRVLVDITEDGTVYRKWTGDQVGMPFEPPAEDD